MENGAPATVINHAFRPAQGATPSYEGFRAEVGRQGFAHATGIYKAMHREYPDFNLAESKLLNGWVYSLINSNHTAEALGLLDAYNEACPESREVYYLYGQAYERAGQKQLAAESYKKALLIEPDFTPARVKLNALDVKDNSK
jgi:tetratricopeptide (TPR) repeat protein